MLQNINNQQFQDNDQQNYLLLKERPRLEGYLYMLNKRAFQIWSKFYFYLNGTYLLIFNDDQKKKIEQAISLDKVIIDGVYEKENMFAITIRNTENNGVHPLEFVASQSQEEITEWKNVLQKMQLIIINDQDYKQQQLNYQKTQNSNKNSNNSSFQAQKNNYLINELINDDINNQTQQADFSIEDIEEVPEIQQQLPNIVLQDNQKLKSRMPSLGNQQNFINQGIQGQKINSVLVFDSQKQQNSFSNGIQQNQLNNGYQQNYYNNNNQMEHSNQSRHNLNLSKNFNSCKNEFLNDQIPIDVLKNVQLQIQNINLRELQNKWVGVNQDSGIPLYKLETQEHLFYKIQLNLDRQFEDLFYILQHEKNEKFWRNYLVDQGVQMKIDDFRQILQSQERFLRMFDNIELAFNKKQFNPLKSSNYIFFNTYSRYQQIFQSQKNQKKLVIIKKEAPQYINEKEKIKQFLLKNDLQNIPNLAQQQYFFQQFNFFYLELEQIKNLNNKSLISLSAYYKVPNLKHQKKLKNIDYLRAVQEQYITENLLNFTIFKYETDQIIKKISKQHLELSKAVLKSIPQPTQQFQNDGIINQINKKNEQTQVDKRFVSGKKFDLIHDRIITMDQKQKQIFNEFLIQVSHIKETDNFKAKFIIAQKFNVQKSIESINEWQEWRERNKMDILKFDKDFPQFEGINFDRIIGTDRFGRPVGFSLTRFVFPKDVKYRLDQYIQRYGVYLYNLMRKGEGKCDTFFVIMDVGKISNKNVDLSITKEQVFYIQKYFPETLHKIYLIHADFFTRMLWSTVKIFIDQKTRDKVVMIKSDYDLIYKELSKDLDDEVIPEVYGGKNKIDGLDNYEK
ncbi:CRAL-TRIO domain [Pseudocohnilembus persalinus]|uniref:CRAL-TRIO domain n=1 Tax=Pseudocohnilembus persalinus TaxID=266149 RepID=A0A0V0QAN8_PSEPJ|nr:CRAL-TRIO domain [Pseudocohnilembus persalinus]|eukprot:KRW99269.1 CRAL-TRIO domain [Pseudocohnilembus persalinus]